MSRIVVAMFEDLTQARDAVQALKDAGYTPEAINLVASDPSGTFAKYLKVSDEDTDAAQDVAQGAGMGAVVGGLGGLLLSLGALAIPGIGPVVAAGPILTALAGAGIGAAAGGLLGALTDLGVPKEQADYYAEAVRRGGVLLTVRTDKEHDDHTMEILQRFRPVDVQQHTSYWKEGEEEIQDADARPMTPSEVQEQHGSPAMVEGDYTPVETVQTVDLAGKIDEQTNYGELSSFMDYASTFHDHYDATYTRQGYTFDTIAPAYQYGYDLALDDQYRQKSWSEVEMDARRDWERKHPDSAWEDIKDAVSHAWHEVTGRL